MAGGFLSSPGRSAKARVTPESTSSGFIPSNTSNPSINGEYTPIRSSLASNWPGGRSLFYRFVVKSSSHMSSKARNLTKKSEKKMFGACRQDHRVPGETAQEIPHSDCMHTLTGPPLRHVPHRERRCISSTRRRHPVVPPPSRSPCLSCWAFYRGCPSLTS